MDFSYIIISIFILLPGFVSFSTLKRSMHREKTSTFGYTLVSIFHSILIWFFIIFTFYLLKPVKEIYILNESIRLILNKNISDFNIENILSILLFLIIVYIISFVFGLLEVYLYRKFKNLYNFICYKFFGKSQMTVWEEIFEKLLEDKNHTDKVVLIKTLSKEFFVGVISTIDGAEDDKYIYFSKVQKYDTTNKTFLEVAANYGFFISSKNIEYIHILPDVDEFDFDNYCKNEEIALELEKIKK